MNETAQPRRRSGALCVAGVVGLVWLAMVGADWWLRFSWFGWQKNLTATPSALAGGPDRPLQVRSRPAEIGGDLTRLVGIPAVAARYEQVRPAATDYTDEYGFRNLPPVTNRYYPVVALGDSYMAAGLAVSNMFNVRLGAAGGVDAYNYSYVGRGPLFSIQRFVNDGRFLESPPKVLVWGLVEREIGGYMFMGLVGKLATESAVLENAKPRSRLNWGALAPASLRTSLPGSSILAQAARKSWIYAQYYIFGRLPEDVAPSTQPIGGQQVLFYRWAVKAMRWGYDERRPDKIAEAIRYVDGLLRQRGTRLVIVLIPDKEQVHRDLLPARLNPPDDPAPPSCLNDIEAELKMTDIPVVNLLGPFREEARKGHLLYWPDDTHWNSDGIDLAARLTWERTAALLGR